MWEVYVVLTVALLMFGVGYLVKDLFFRRLALLYSAAFLLLVSGYYLRSIVNVGAYGSLMDFLSYAMFLYAFFLSYKLVKTQRKEMGKRHLDPMTGLFNRLYLEEVLPRRIEAILTLGLNYLTIFLDIDNLKQVNDTYGHLKGDELIKNLAKAINQSIRGHEDVAIRYGGDGLRSIEIKVERLEVKVDALEKRMDLLQKQVDELRSDFRNYMSIVLGALFTVIVGIIALIGFILWDRRTALSPVAKKTKELEDKSDKIEKVLKDLAKRNPEIEEALKRAGLL